MAGVGDNFPLNLILPVQDEGNWQHPGARPPQPPPVAGRPPQPPGDMHRPLSIEEHAGSGVVSAINKVFTKRARRLYIFDIANKLKHMDTYDIGGTYADNGAMEPIPELWFFFSTTICPGQNYLLNLFVCHRRTGSFYVGIPSSNEIIHKKKTSDKAGQTLTNDVNSWQHFRNTQPDEYFHVKTFCFTENDLKAMENNTLIILTKIEINVTCCSSNNEVVKKIKLNHDFGDILAKQEKTDFVLISQTQKQYPVHRIFLAAHSPILRDLIKTKAGAADGNHAFIDITDVEMELLLQFIYTGTIKDILQQNCAKLLQIADRFQLKNLFSLTQFALGEQINIENAVEIASISDKYNLEKLQLAVFSFIKNNPKVLDTEGWKNLNDVNLAKKLFQCLQTKRD